MPEAFFLKARHGYRFCIYHPAKSGIVRGAIVYVHPLAEELNKSRRMAAMQCRTLAEAGFATLQIDLLGCGDSSGDFGDANWNDWLEDTLLACRWLRQSSQAPLWLWGLRAGCLIAADAARGLGEPVNFLFWQPSISGKQVLQQFLRLRVAGDLMTGDGKGVMASLKAEIATGRPVEIVGYHMPALLANQLEQSELAPPANCNRVVWIELSSRPDAGLAPASRAQVEKWRGRCPRTEALVAVGAPFWQTTEIEEAPTLIEASMRAIDAAEPA